MGEIIPVIGLCYGIKCCILLKKSLGYSVLVNVASYIFHVNYTWRESVNNVNAAWLLLRLLPSTDKSLFSANTAQALYIHFSWPHSNLITADCCDSLVQLHTSHSNRIETHLNAVVIIALLVIHFTHPSPYLCPTPLATRHYWWA